MFCLLKSLKDVCDMLSYIVTFLKVFFVVVRLEKSNSLLEQTQNNNIDLKKCGRVSTALSTSITDIERLKIYCTQPYFRAHIREPKLK